MNIERAIEIQKIIKQQTEKNKKFRRDLQNNLIDFSEDAEKEKRMKEKKCKTCYYLRKNLMTTLDSQTTHICKLCEKSFYALDSHERICTSCVAEHDICKYCGEKIE